jgi:selenocysteine lyase/cysteine desulfurase
VGTGVGIGDIHRHAEALQRRFLDGLDTRAGARLPRTGLKPAEGVPRGNFLAFDVEDAEDCHRRIAAERVYIDRRGRRLRFGFGVYHDDDDVDRVLEAVARALG